MKFSIFLLLFALIGSPIFLSGQVVNRKSPHEDKFRQLEEILPTPNDYRGPSGAPGSRYWQQRVDYDIDVEIDDTKQKLIGSERITYTNNSPDTLRYLWVQLDNNIFAPNSDSVLATPAPPLDPKLPMRGLRSLLTREVFDGSVKITVVQDEAHRALPYTVVKTMMRVDLPQSLRTGQSFTFRINWHYQINNSKLVRGRTGFEYFEEDKNYIYEMAHWYPRMASYTDVNGWHHKQFLGRGEFTLEFGDFLVRITAPSDHVVAATGVLQNSKEVLSSSQQKRLEEAQSATKPIFVITPEEAKENEKSRASEKKTWIFKADQVRDFAFATSRKFIWDAKLHNVEGNRVMAMSYYPNEAEPLWSKYSTQSIIHTLNVYSRYSFTYPYPVAISVNGPVFGMEYPMICFNGPRPEKDKTYSKRTKYALISVIIHEVGHNYFPMIVNSDERQWTWMDEGLNTFLQYLTEQEWEENYPSRRGEPKNMVSYMNSKNQVPIMTNSESILQFGNNAYGKPATALNVLRESILGRELFDFAFREYAQRWKFKRPMPADFFRTMEDASGIDLDWFWRGWFYSTDHTDISIDDVILYTMETGDPEIDKAALRKERDEKPKTLSKQRNKTISQLVDLIPNLKDFYNEYDRLDVTPEEKKAYEKFLKDLDPEDKELLQQKNNFYIIKFSNIGGLVMPIILEVEYEDGSKEELRIPAEIWRYNPKNVSKLIIREKKIRSLNLDPHLETADVNLDNNYFPRRIIPSRFSLFKMKQDKNPMQVVEERKKKAAEEAQKTAEEAQKSAKETQKEAKKTPAKTPEEVASTSKEKPTKE